MAPAGGGALFSSAVEDALHNLKSSEISQNNQLDPKLVDSLKLLLLSTHHLLHVDEPNQHPNLHPHHALPDLRDTVFDLEDVLDDIHIDPPTPSLQSRIQQLLQLLRRHGAKVETSEAEAEAEAEAAVLPPRARPTNVSLATTLVDQTETSVVYGRDYLKEQVIDLLISHPHNPTQTIAILGTPGLGKTTVARLAYNHSIVNHEFELKAWVSVNSVDSVGSAPSQFDISRITRITLGAIHVPVDDGMDLNILQDKLEENLSAKKFLIVLDGVWIDNAGIWAAFVAPFECGASGSKILITTEFCHPEISSAIDHLVMLDALSEQHSWSLFSKHALHPSQSHSTSSFEETGRKIVAKCKGMPLALKLIAGLLSTMSSDQWNGVLTSEMWNDEPEFPVWAALRLSYHCLPSHLKRCFVYCSLFPVYYEFDKEHLVQLWMAENFLPFHQQNNKELGHQIFNDLLSRSFFQQSRGDTTRFVMHDLLRAYARSISDRFCIKLEDTRTGIDPYTHHLSFVGNFEQSRAIFIAKRLRTFLPLSRFGSDPCHNNTVSFKMVCEILSKFKYLRVLSLCGYINVDVLPETIGQLKHLRYLDLSASGVSKLPETMCSLSCLQTLKLRNCQYLSELPSDMYKLQNLLYLDLRGTMVSVLPKWLKELKNLEVLCSDYADSQDATWSSDDERSSFEMLTISNISQLQKQLPSMLDGLRIEGFTYLESLPNNMLLPSKLQELYLADCHSLKSFPQDGFPVSLKALYVSNCPKLEIFSISESMPKLASLEYLCLGDSCESLTVFILSFFPKLKSLSLWKCSNLALVAISKEFEDDLASLESLEIRDCPNLESFPKRGLPTPNMSSLLLSNCKVLNNIPNSNNSLRSLQSLVLHKCPALESLSLQASSTLTSLSISFCGKLTPLKSWGLHKLQHLSSFEIEGGCDGMESFPEEELLPRSLNSLRISALQSLKRLDYNGLRHLNALQELQIDGCNQLQLLTEQELPSSLVYLSIKQSPLLTQKWAGEDWHKVAHVPEIEIDGKVTG